MNGKHQHHAHVVWPQHQGRWTAAIENEFIFDEVVGQWVWISTAPVIQPATR